MKLSLSAVTLLFLVVLVTTLCTATPVDWSSLTAEQLSQLTPQEVSSASSSDLSSIQDASCAGFRVEQLEALTDTYSTNKCGGFNGGCMANMLPEVYSGFQKGCISHWTQAAASAVTALQLSNVTAESAVGFTKDVLSAFTTSCSGLKAYHLESISNSYGACNCAGLGSECMANIPAEEYEGFKGDCLGCLSSKALAETTAEQLSNLSPNAAPGIRATQLSALKEQCSGLQEDFLMNLYNMFGITTCAGFSAQCLGAISKKAAFGFQSKCISAFTVDAVSGINAEVMSGFDANQFDGWKKEQVAVWTDSACSGLQSSHIYNLYNQYGSYSCQGLTSTCMQNMQPIAYSGFKGSCIQYIPSSAFDKVLPNQLTQIPDDSCSGLKADQLSNLKIACPGFRAGQLGQLYNLFGTNTCAGMTSACMSDIPAKSYSGFKSNCISIMPEDAFSHVEATQIAQLTENAITGIQAKHLTVMNATACEGFSSGQTASFYNLYGQKTCAGMQPECIQSMSDSALSGFISSCTTLFPDNALSLIVAEQLSSFSLNGVSGFTKGVISKIPPKSCAGFDQSRISSIYNLYGANACAGFTSQCIANIHAEECSGFKADCTSALGVPSLDGFQQDQLQYLTPNAIAGFSTQKLVHLIGRTDISFVDTITQEQLANIQTYTIIDLKDVLTAGNPISPEKILTDGELANSTWLKISYSTLNSTLATLSKSTLTLLPSPAIMGIRRDQMYNLPADILAKVGVKFYKNILEDTTANITGSQIAFVVPEAFSDYDALGERFGFLSLETIPSITSAQFKAALSCDIHYLFDMNCNQFKVLTIEQTDLMKKEKPDYYTRNSQKCGVPPTPEPSTATSPIQSVEESPQQSALASPEQSLEISSTSSPEPSIAVQSSEQSPSTTQSPEPTESALTSPTPSDSHNSARIFVASSQLILILSLFICFV